MSRPMTDKVRAAFVACFLVSVIFGIAGWFAGLDLMTYSPVLGATTAAAGIGEGSNVGKRATYKPEA